MDAGRLGAIVTYGGRVYRRLCIDGIGVNLRLFEWLLCRFLQFLVGKFSRCLQYGSRSKVYRPDLCTSGIKRLATGRWVGSQAESQKTPRCRKISMY